MPSEPVLEIDEDGNKHWSSNDHLHRTDSPTVEFYGNKFWYLNGKRHRTDGPAVIYNSGTRVWFQNDKLHRDDGPAVEYSDGNNRWCLNGVEYNFEEYCEELKLSREQTIKLAIKYSS